jgi:putative acetyltransferase
LKESPLKSTPPCVPERPRIEPERPGDAPKIGQITTTAFAPMPFSDGDEARIIDALREAGALTVSLVAIAADGELIGHIALSPVRIDGQPSDWYGLGPVSVAPEIQSRGIGSALIAEGLDRLRELKAGGCVLLGDPNYYSRFGFVSVPTLTYRGKPNRYFQRLVLGASPRKGDVCFHPAFDAS